MNESGQQWDFPNAWPPLQQILVAGKMPIFSVQLTLFHDVLSLKYYLKERQRL
jgi:hypothetical protein